MKSLNISLNRIRQWGEKFGEAVANYGSETIVLSENQSDIDELERGIVKLGANSDLIVF